MPATVYRFQRRPQQQQWLLVMPLKTVLYKTHRLSYKKHRVSYKNHRVSYKKHRVSYKNHRPSAPVARV